MDVLLCLANGLVDWTTKHWFLTFLILYGFKGIRIYFGDPRKKKEDDKEGRV